MSIEFLVTSVIVVLSPGTSVLFILSAGLSGGSRAGIVAAIGCTFGIVPHLLAAIFGLAALLHASALAFETLKVMGVGYLLYLAWGAWRERGSLHVRQDVPARADWEVVVAAILVNILNPKLSIYFFAFLPQFISAGEPAPVLRMLELGAVFGLLTLVISIGYGLFAAGIRSHVIARPGILTWIRRAFAAAFVALSAKLAVAER